MTAIPDFLVDYIATRDRERAELVTALLDGLTDRERRIAEVAAIVGHQLGIPHGRQGAPPDSEIVAMVTGVITSFPTDLTPREKYLLHDAAVMGFVRGGLNGAALDDESAVAHVVACCQSMSDLYPVLAGDARALIVRLVRKHQPVEESRLVEAVAELCARDPDEVTTMVRELLADGELTETGYGLKIGEAQ
jgi:predicted transcriptional regulator